MLVQEPWGGCAGIAVGRIAGSRAFKLAGLLVWVVGIIFVVGYTVVYRVIM